MTSAMNVKPLEALIFLAPEQQVRVRFLGNGPPVIMLHESPRSSAALLPLANRLAEQFTCILMDTPGFGLSELLPLSRPEIPDYAQRALAVAAALGLDSVPFYGTHTGAAIAAEAAYQAPERVSAAVLDGYAMFSAAERDELLAVYLPPFQHSLDGTHVAWLWSRVRDQFTAFPWHRVGDAGRLPYGPPPLETLQAVVDDFLLADDHYRAGYSAAFRYDHLFPIRNTKTTIHVATRTDDLLYPHLKNATELPDNVSVEALSADRTIWAARIAELLAISTTTQSEINSETLLQRTKDCAGDRYIANTSVGPVVVRFDGPNDAAPILLLADVPGNLSDLDHLTQRLQLHYRVLRIDLPGIGFSRLYPDCELNLNEIAKGLQEALQQLNLINIPIIACGASLALAVNLVSQNSHLVALDPWPQVTTAAAEVPDLKPRWDGAHLFAAFHWARDYDLYKPWYHRSNAEGRELGGERDVLRLHKRFRAVVWGGQTGSDIARLLYRHDCSKALQERREVSAVLAFHTDSDHEAVRTWASALIDDKRVISVSRDAGQLAQSIAATLTELRHQ